MTDNGMIETADRLIAEYHPCQMHGSSCLAGDPNPCCWNSRFAADDWCPHLGRDGCLNPNVECKVWFCVTAVSKMHPDCLASFRELEKEGIKEELIHPPYLGDPNYVGADRLP